jgi:predicted nuclease of predicted toxin-antitoxin system
LRLLLDEHYSHEIAEQLRERGHDVTAVTGDPALEGLDDESLLGLARDQGRALLTNNVRDFALLILEWTGRGESHAGVIYTSDDGMPRSRNTIGLFVERLSALLDNHPGEESFRDRVEWLRPGA